MPRPHEGLRVGVTFHGRERFDDIGRDPGVVADDDVRDPAVARDDDGGRKRLQAEGLGRHALRIEGKRPHAAELGELLADGRQRLVVGIEAHGDVLHRRPRAAVVTGVGGGKVGDARGNLWERPGGGPASCEEEVEDEGGIAERFAGEWQAVDCFERGQFGLRADSGMERFRPLEGLEPCHFRGSGRHVEREGLSRHIGLERGIGELDLNGDADRRPGFLRESRSVSGRRHSHLAQQFRLTIDPEAEHAIWLRDLKVAAGMSVDRLGADDPGWRL